MNDTPPSPQPSDEAREARLRELIASSPRLIDRETTDVFLLRLLDAARAEIAALDAEATKQWHRAQKLTHEVDDLNEELARLRSAAPSGDLRTENERLRNALDTAESRFIDLARIIKRDGSYNNAGFLRRSAERCRAALASSPPDAVPCTHTNIDKYGQCEMCGQWGNFTQPDAGAKGELQPCPRSDLDFCKFGDMPAGYYCKRPPSPSPEAAPPSGDAMEEARALLFRCHSLNDTIYEEQVKRVAAALTRRDRAAAKKMREAAEQWHLSQRPKLSGPDYGMASEKERSAMRSLDRFHVNCASAIAALPLPPDAAS